MRSVCHAAADRIGSPARAFWNLQMSGSKVHTSWMLVCVVTSAPGVLYSVVKAVPGFLHVSGFWRWLINNAVALISGIVTGFGLDILARKVSRHKSDSARLQLAGLLLASIVLPGLVALIKPRTKQ
eukprot:4643206-Amphidinium_carterae.1